jgi:type VI secretion system protein ImpF
MPNPKDVRPDQPLLASVIDRLLDDDPSSGGEPRASPAALLADLQNGLRRDIEMLLNTHQYCRLLPRELTELSLSLLDYGAPHFLGLAAASAAAREQFRENVEGVLRRFEPRLKHVQVSLVESADGIERTMRFRIDAIMMADPEPEPVGFDSILEPTNRRFSVTTVSL